MRVWIALAMWTVGLTCCWAADEEPAAQPAESVTVVDHNGAPVAGARVYVAPPAEGRGRNRGPSRTELHRLATDSQGVCDLSRLPNPIAEPFVYVAHPDHPLAALRMIEPEAIARLETAEVMHGRIFGESWTPLAGARIGPRATGRDEADVLPPAVVAELSVTAGPDGEYTSPWLLGPQVTDVEVRADGYAATGMDRSALIAGVRLERLGSLVVELEPLTPGLALGGIELVCSGPSDRGPDYRRTTLPFSVTARSDQAGVVRLEGVPPGAAMLKPGDDADTWVGLADVRVRSGVETRVQLAARPYAPVTGRVLDVAGAPVTSELQLTLTAGAAATVSEEGLRALDWFYEDTVDQGYIASRLPVGDYDLEILGSGGWLEEGVATLSFTLPPEGTDLGELRLATPDPEPGRWNSPPRTIAGRLLGPDGSPVAGEVWAVTEDYGRRASVAAAGEDGSFALEVPSSMSALVIGRAPGCSTEAVLVGADTAQVEVRLGAARTIGGRVVDRDGGGLSARVVAYRAGHVPYVASLHTDPDGSFSIGDAPAKDVLLFTDAPGYSPEWTVADRAAGDLSLRLEPEPRPAIIDLGVPEYLRYDSALAERLGSEALAALESGVRPTPDEYDLNGDGDGLVLRGLWADPVRAIRLATGRDVWPQGDDLWRALRLLEDAEPDKAVRAYQTLYGLSIPMTAPVGSRNGARANAAAGLYRLGVPGAERLLRQAVASLRGETAAIALAHVDFPAALGMVAPDWHGGPLPQTALGPIREFARSHPAEAVAYARCLAPRDSDIGPLSAIMWLAEPVVSADPVFALSWAQRLRPTERFWVLPYVAASGEPECALTAVERLRDIFRLMGSDPNGDPTLQLARIMQFAGHSQWRDQALRDAILALVGGRDLADDGCYIGMGSAAIPLVPALRCCLPDLADVVAGQVTEECRAVPGRDGPATPPDGYVAGLLAESSDPNRLDYLSQPTMPSVFLSPSRRLRASVTFMM